MSFTQRTFLGASIRGWNANIGWGQSTSQCTFDLIEDPSNNDLFVNPGTGKDVYFNYGGWTFNGIIQNTSIKNAVDGKRLISVSVVDPREILTGVQIILDGYYGSVYNVPNLYNVYGYYENITFGSSQKNESGIPWRNAVNGLLFLISGTPIKFRGSRYYLDLSQLPPIPNEYRISSPNLSIMDLVSEICEVGGCDFFFSLINSSAGGIISLVTIPRNTPPFFGRISSYVNSINHTIQHESGFELQPNITSKFVIGGAVEQMYFNFINLDEDDEEDRTIHPFWGFDRNKNIIFDEGTGNNRKMVLNGDAINVFGDWKNGYKADVGELRAALMSQESWEFYLATKSDDVWHQEKVKKLQLIKMGSVGNLNLIFAGVDAKKLSPAKLGLAHREFPKIDDRIYQEKLTSVFEFVRNYASEYYGRKFMVQIPFVFVKIEPETGRVITSLEKAESGYIEENLFPVAVGNGLAPDDIKSFLDQDNKLVAYVRFSRTVELDVSRINPDDYIVTEKYVFVKCSVDDHIIFRDRITGFSPRLVITTAGPVIAVDDSDDNFGLLTQVFEDRKIDKSILNSFIAAHGGNMAGFGEGGFRLFPSMAALPLRSNILSYGPWYAIGDEGKTEFIVNEELVPWNFHGFTDMNKAGNATVSEAITNYQIVERGSFDAPDTPAISLGVQLLNGGPYLTDINVTVGDDGVKTSYRFETWPVRPGRFNQWASKRIHNLHRLFNEHRRKFRELFSAPKGIYSPSKLEKFRIKPAKGRMGSSHHFIMANIKGSGTDLTADVVSSPVYNVITELSDNYSKKAGMTLDGLLRPFSTNTDASGIMKYGVPASGALTPTINDLNPFAGGHDIDFVVFGDAVPENSDLVPDQDNQRPLCLKGPVVVGGWGYDTNGKPVPNDTPGAPSESFVHNHKSRMDLWKVGPLDIRWDDIRKVWTGAAPNVVAQYSTSTFTASANNSLTLDFSPIFKFPNNHYFLYTDYAGIEEILGNIIHLRPGTYLLNGYLKAQTEQSFAYPYSPFESHNPTYESSFPYFYLNRPANMNVQLTIEDGTITGDKILTYNPGRATTNINVLKYETKIDVLNSLITVEPEKIGKLITYALPHYQFDGFTYTGEVTFSITKLS